MGKRWHQQRFGDLRRTHSLATRVRIGLGSASNIRTFLLAHGELQACKYDGFPHSFPVPNRNCKAALPGFIRTRHVAGLFSTFSR